MGIGKDLLKISDLKVSYDADYAYQAVLDGMDFVIREGEVLALVGASGCGKSTAALSILKLLNPKASIEKGKIIYKGKDLLSLSLEDMRKIRGREISIIFQEPLSALNPVFNIGYQMSEMLKLHPGLDSNKIDKRILELLKQVGIPSPDRVVGSYPHQLSGGMRQRVVIAMSISLNPKLIIADEPTSNLDVTLQAQILDLFRKLKKELGLSILLITHDLGIVENLADRICIMQNGKVIEEDITPILLRKPQKDYTKELLRAADY